jgi:glutamate formiminotransferase
MERVTELAAKAGTAVSRSELIGLIPQEAMFQAAAHFLKLPDFNATRTVENAVQLAQARAAEAAIAAADDTGGPARA